MNKTLVSNGMSYSLSILRYSPFTTRFQEISNQLYIFFLNTIMSQNGVIPKKCHLCNVDYTLIWIVYQVSTTINSLGLLKKLTLKGT